jgi:hypothetical protein
VKKAWDGNNLRFTFRRTVGRRAMAQWMELQQIASSISFTDETDAMIWHFNSSGRYSVQSLYGIVTDRGVRQIFTPVVWKIIVPQESIYFYGCWPRIKSLLEITLIRGGS